MIRVDKNNFTLPSYKGLFSKQTVKESDITSKVVLFKDNPYTWHKSASKGNVDYYDIFSINLN